MSKSLQLALCDTQGKLFELAAQYGYSSEAFIKSYMLSETAQNMDMEFHHIQWAGKQYILSSLKEECGIGLSKGGAIYDKEVLYWIGYIYRYWNLYTGESSKAIYRQASAKRMNTVYLMYHTMGPELAIARLKETGK